MSSSTSRPERTICECCHPSLTIARDGPGVIHAMWRNALEGDRDMYTSISRDGGRTFGPASKLGSGTWHLQACPMDGGGVAVMKEWQGGIDVPAGNRKSSWRSMDSLRLRWPRAKITAIAADASGVFIAWSGAEGLMAKVPGAAQPLRLDPDGAFPQLIALPGGGVLAAWERKGEVSNFRGSPEARDDQILKLSHRLHAHPSTDPRSRRRAAC